MQRNFCGVFRRFYEVRMIYNCAITIGIIEFSADNSPRPNRQLFHPIIEKFDIEKLYSHRCCEFISTYNLTGVSASFEYATAFMRFYHYRNSNRIARLGFHHRIQNFARSYIRRNMQQKIKRAPSA